MNDVTNLHGPDDPETEARLARALHRQAETITPGSRLSEIRAEGRRGRTGKAVALAAAAMVAAVVGGLVVGTLIQGGGPTTVSDATRSTDPGGAGSTAAEPAPTTPSTPPSSNSPSKSASVTTKTAKPAATVPVYWLGPQDKLFREFVPAQSTSDNRAVAAVETMLGSSPLDPDYQRGPWQQATGVKVSQSGEDLTVDLPAGAFADEDVDAETAKLALQQLVYTATAAVQAQGSVTVLIDGKPGTAWGQVKVGSPMKRELASRASVWITDPQQDDTAKAGSVTIKGSATAFEGNVVWQVTRSDGTVVKEGHTMAGANGTYDDFTFTVELTPGTYEVTVTAPDASGRTDGTSDNKSFTVK